MRAVWFHFAILIGESCCFVIINMRRMLFCTTGVMFWQQHPGDKSLTKTKKVGEITFAAAEELN